MSFIIQEYEVTLSFIIEPAMSVMTTISLCFKADLEWIPKNACDDLLTDLFSTLRAYLLKYKLQKILLKIHFLKRTRLRCLNQSYSPLSFLILHLMETTHVLGNTLYGRSCWDRSDSSNNHYNFLYAELVKGVVNKLSIQYWHLSHYSLNYRHWVWNPYLVD